jgi:spermine/spermidine synthase
MQTTTPPRDASEDGSSARTRVSGTLARARDARFRLFVASFLMLFVELVLIRWLGAHVVYLSYFSNFVLLGSFLGIGIGFLRSDSDTWFARAPMLLAILLAAVIVAPVEIDRTGGNLVFFGSEQTTGLPIWATLPLVFLATAVTMAAIAQGVARLFSTFAPLQAYRLDVLGSIAGIVTFAALSFLGAPPFAWGLVIAMAFVVLFDLRPTVGQAASLCVIVTVFAAYLFVPGTIWSPYYRITYQSHGPTTAISVNGIPHQSVTTIALNRKYAPSYFIPYERMSGIPLDDVLVVGAGTGNDVAIALSAGAKHVDAVEIDPRLYQLGIARNPEHPYDDPRVHVFIGDGRAFLERSNTKYDLILFALPDSLTLVAGQSSLRLESYLFTREAITAVKSHLVQGGVFSMYNYYRYAWLADRLAGTLKAVFGQTPCFDSTRQAGYLAVLTVSADASSVSCPTPWEPVTKVVPPATDDRPFVYLRETTVPGFYLVALGLILLVSLVGVRLIAGRFGPMRPYLDLFFMGAAFLLLETKNVVQFALLFGTTWFVNALVFAGILITVLLAIEVASRAPPIRPVILYGVLAIAVAIGYAVPAHALLELAFVPRFVAATALAFAPVFCANLVFAERFRGVDATTAAFGANLLGAMVGGALEYSALMIGYRSLLLVAAGIYLLAYVAGRRSLRVA